MWLLLKKEARGQLLCCTVIRQPPTWVLACGLGMQVIRNFFGDQLTKTSYILHKAVYRVGMRPYETLLLCSSFVHSKKHMMWQTPPQVHAHAIARKFAMALASSPSQSFAPSQQICSTYRTSQPTLRPDNPPPPRPQRKTNPVDFGFRGSYDKHEYQMIALLHR